MALELPRASALPLHAPAPGTLPALVLLACAAPGSDPTHDRALVTPSVAMTLALHPSVQHLLARPGPATTWRDQGRALHPDLAQALTWLRPDAWQLTGRPDHALPARPRGSAGPRLLVERRAASARLTLPTDASVLEVPGSHWVALTPLRALEVLARAATTGLVALDADPHRALLPLLERAQHATIALPVPTAPGWCVVRTGTAKAPTPVPAADVDPARTVLAPAVLQARQTANAAATDRPGLRPHQDRAVSAYLACGPGLVDASPTGSGKTVTAAASLAERARHHTGDAPWRALVLAPASLHPQWVDELAAHAPGLPVSRSATGEDLRAALSAAVGVILATPTLAADALTDSWAVADLVVDEADVLTNPAAATTRTLWRVRARADKALVLTATAAERRGAVGAAHLLAYARNDHAVTRRGGPRITGDRLAPYVLRADAAGKPPVDLTQPTLDPSPLEARLDAALLELASADVAAGTCTALRAQLHLNRLRLAAASPAAALQGKDRQLADLAARCGATASTLSSRQLWAADLCAAEPGHVIVADSAAALTQLHRHLAAQGEVGLLTSAVTPALRASTLEAFTTGALPTLLLGPVGQVGLNLQRAHTLAHLDLPPNLAALTQRTGRVARIGSPHARVTSTLPALTGTSEERRRTLLLKGRWPRPARDALAALLAA